MPAEVVRKKLFDYDALQVKVHNGKERYKPKHRTYLINNDDLEIWKDIMRKSEVFTILFTCKQLPYTPYFQVHYGIQYV